MMATNMQTRSGLAQDCQALQEFGDRSIFIGDYMRTQRHYGKGAAPNMNNPIAFAKIIHTIEMYLKMHINDSDTVFSCNAMPKKIRLKIPKYSGYNPCQYFLTIKMPKVIMKKLNVT